MPQNQNFRLPTLTLNNYYPYGMLQAGRSRNAGGYRFGFNGMENDNKKGGLGEHVDFGARGLNTWTTKFYGIDPLWAKYPNISSYAFVANSPIMFVDKDGRDIVYFDAYGTEINRVISDKIFQTWVEKVDCYPTQLTNFELAPMPGVAKGYEKCQYQQHDYVIAAETFIFNRDLYQSNYITTPTNAHIINMEGLPEPLDVNIVKALVLEESKAGNYVAKKGDKRGETAAMDVAQINNGYKNPITGKTDWSDQKKRVGLVENVLPNPQQSIHSSVTWLFWKGLYDFRGTKTGKYERAWNPEWGWWDAVEGYNGGGNKNYKTEVREIYESMSPAKPENY